MYTPLHFLELEEHGLDIYASPSRLGQANGFLCAYIMVLVDTTDTAWVWLGLDFLLFDAVPYYFRS